MAKQECIRTLKTKRAVWSFVIFPTGEFFTGYKDDKITAWDLKRCFHLKSFKEYNLKMVNSFVYFSR